MSDKSEHLERLISRYLDDESDASERRELKRAVRRDPFAGALFDEISSLDRETRVALRGALGRPLADRRPLPLWSRVARTIGIAAAACLAGMLWLQPINDHGRSDNPAQAGAGSGASWFAPPPVAADTLSDGLGQYERPRIRLENTDRNWIVIPSDKPGEFLVIEVDRIHTRAILVQQDF